MKNKIDVIRIQRHPVIKYAYPKNGFLPPNHDVLEKMNAFLPLNCVTGKSIKKEI